MSAPPRERVADHAASPPEAPPPPTLDDADAEDVRAALEHSWRQRSGFRAWLTSVDHKSIARRYLATAFVLFALAGVLALLMRTQLARPENGFIGPDLYDQLFTTHGTTMMFLFAVPVMQAAGLYLVPLMIGTRNVAFPRLNAFGYWTYLIGGVLLYVALLANSGADTGWFSYVPLAGPEYGPGKRPDVWAQTVTFTEIAAIVAAIEIIVTTLKMRAPGMTLARLPLFVWAQLVTAFMVLFAMPTIATASIFLALDRLVDTRFFDPSQGGDPLLWQHLFWWFGHPEVYIIFLPALGMISSIVATFTRRPIFGYPLMVASMVGTGFVSFGLWVHHMFATPLPTLGASFFTAASVLIAIFTGTQIFCWIATLWLGRSRLSAPLLWVLGFFALFMLGGVTGVMIASVPFDLQAHDTYFIVAHFHYVLIGGAVTPLVGAALFWFPKVAGRVLSERLGKLSFALFFVGVNVTFFPMHLLGLEGMPRRVYTYLEGSGWGPLNFMETVGAYLLAVSILLLVGNVWWALRRPADAPADPWGGESLEWTTSSPPPAYDFAFLPVVRSRTPSWDTEERAAVTGLRTDRPEALLSTMLDAEPESKYQLPGPSIWPLVAALAIGVFFITAIFTPWGVVIGSVLLFPALLLWGWPRGDPEGQHDARTKARERRVRERHAEAAP